MYVVRVHCLLYKDFNVYRIKVHKPNRVHTVLGVHKPDIHVRVYTVSSVYTPPPNYLIKSFYKTSIKCMGVGQSSQGDTPLVA